MQIVYVASVSIDIRLSMVCHSSYAGETCIAQSYIHVLCGQVTT